MIKDICPECGECTAKHNCRRLIPPNQRTRSRSYFMFLKKMPDVETINYDKTRTTFYVCLKCGELHMHYDHRSSDYNDYEVWLKPGEEYAPSKWLKFSHADAEILRPRAEEIRVLHTLES